MLKQIQTKDTKKARKLFMKAKNRRTISFAVALLVALVGIGLVFLQLSTGVEANWWTGGEQWLKRKNLELVNTTNESLAATTTVAITVNTKELVSEGKLRQDCADLRVLYQPNSGTATEVTRHLIFPANESCATSETTKVYFPLQATLGASSKSYDYYMYFANPDAVAPTDTDRAFDIGSKQALLVCPFNGTTECAAGETPSTETGAIRYGGAKSALSFDGVDDRVNVNYQEGTLSEGTIEFYVKLFRPHSSSGDRDLGLLRNTVSGQEVLGEINVRFYDGNGSLEIMVNNGSGGINMRSNKISWDAGVWYHITYAWNGTDLTLYVDGVMDNNWSMPHGMLVDEDMNIGFNNNYLPGLIDEFRISNVARYTGNFTPQTTPFVRDDNTVLLYHFDENGDDPRNTGYVFDDSGNNNHGLIFGSAKYVAGLVGVDSGSESGMTGVGNVAGSNSFAGHEGIFVEEGTTNKITNPSFEHATYNTSWTASGGTATENTNPAYVKFGSKSLKIELSGSDDQTVTTTADVGNARNNTFSAYVYRGTSGNVGGTVDSSVAQLVFNGSPQTTTYTDAGGGWWRMTYTGNARSTESYANENIDADQGLFSSASNRYLSQGFQVSNNTTVDRVVIPLKKVGPGTQTTQRYKVEIQTDNAGVPSGTAVENGVSDCMPRYNGANYENRRISFPVNPHLLASTQYHIVVKPYTDTACNTPQTNPDGTNYTVWGYDSSSSAYSNGDRATSDGSLWSVQSGQDHIFTLYTYASDAEYGVQINENSGILYIDGVQLEHVELMLEVDDYLYAPTYAYATSFVDGSLGSEYSWNGVANESTSTRTKTGIKYEAAGNIDETEYAISLWFKPIFEMNQLPCRGSFTQSFVIYSLAENLYPTDLDYLGVHLRPTSCTTGGMNRVVVDVGRNSHVDYDWAIDSNSKDKWHHLYVSASTTNGVKVFLNNVEKINDPTPVPQTTIDSITIGSRYHPYNGCDVGGCEQGVYKFSDLRIYDSSLTDAEVTDLYYSGLVSHSQSYEVNRFSGDKGQDPLAIWHFDESYGSTAHDSSTYKHNLAISGASWNTQSVGAHNRLVRNLQFDGTDDVATLQAGAAGNFNFGTGSFTLSGWFRHASTISGPDTIISRYNTAGYKVYMNSSGQICFGIDDDSTWGPDDVACSTQSYANSKWHHFEAVRDTGTIILYIDGLQVANAAVTATGSLSNSASLTVGADSNSTNFWTGNLDEIIVYPYARSEEQVKTDFAGGQTSAYFGASQNDFMTDGLVGYWKMDESTDQSRIDSSGNGNTLTQSAGDVIDAAAGKFGSGADFENSSSEAETLYIDDSSHNGLDITGQITIATWVRRESINWGINNLVSKHHSDSGQRSYMLTLNGTQLEFWLSPDGNSPTQVSIAEAVPLNDTWYHIVGAYDGTRMMLYINGSLASDPVSYNGGIFNSTANFRIGGSDSGWYFDGVIDETRIYNRALSPDEVRALYDWAPGPVGYWDLNEGTGVTAYDKSGNNNHGTLGGDGVGSDVPTWDRGQYGDALKFGTDDFVSVADAPELQISGAMTLSAWMRPEIASNYIGTIVGKGGPSGQRSYYIGIQSNTSVQFTVASGPSTSYNTSITYDWTQHVGEWMHLAAVFDPGVKTEFYVNGTKVGGRTDSVPASQHSDNGRPLLIGARNSESAVPAFPFQNGLIDEVKVYNYALTPQQITEDINAGHPIGGSPVGSKTLYWKFDEGHGTTANDFSATGNYTGTISGATWSNAGKFDKALSLGATNHSVSAGDVAFVDGVNALTASLWINPQSLATDRTIISKSNHSNQNNFLVRTDATNSDEIRVYIASSGSDTSNYVTTTNLDLATDEWIHLTMVYDGTLANQSRVKVFKNGNQVATSVTGTIPTSLTSGTSSALMVGDSAISGSESIIALVDEVKIYTAVLTPEQVSIDMNAGSAISMGGVMGDSEASTLSDGAGAPPVAYWNFNEKTGTTAQDTSGNGNSGTLGGDGVGSDVPTWKGAGDCKNGACLEFDGSDDWIDTGQEEAFRFENTSFTVSGWFKTSAASGYLVSKNGSTEGWSISHSSTLNVGLKYTTENATVRTSNSTINDGDWHHFGAVITTDTSSADGNNIEIYLDGKLDQIASYTKSNPYNGGTNGNLLLGRRSSGNYFGGMLDSVKIYDYARTPAQIAWDYNRGGPVGWWKLDENDGNIVNDASGNNLNGTLGDTDSTASDDPTWVAGRFGSALDFDGNDDHVRITSTLLDITQTITLAAWVNPANYDNWFNQFVSKSSGGSTSQRAYYLRLVGGAPCFSFNQSNTERELCAYNVSAPIGTWTHVAGVYDGTTQKVYLNGVLVASTPRSGPIDIETGSLRIGKLHGTTSESFAGGIDDVRIYNYALSETQVRTIMNNGVVRFGP